MSLVRSSKTTPAVCCFCRIETLGYFEDTEAKKLLENVARSMQPIMKKRNWTVLLLSEFYPRNRNLFGLHINEGEEIKVRLREPENVKTLLPFESVVGTILHELAHFVHKKHDKSFYLLLDQLTTEYEACFVGFGKGNFNSDKGQRIGGKISKPSTKQEKRNLLAQAAETRRIRAGLLCGAQKLGGSSPQSSSTPQQMAVLAAIRRMKDQERCGTVDS
ncbi:DNA-dependent metalloprotease WSS1 [Galdieria sulphuraria]|uniref:WLM domain-containing protein n=1 Tax=Galdieria sulphuraria TaxID=130081 RepID=M2W8B0_GALSU|nr:uncharacterized protein Gasu_08530 [Galdieria sulphuraria]EME32111.1 hypothetical protein Gasu_08530 [Galdieria sulphuraria]GJD06650.1 DNA-dependent metalloprotease WSS1 [Galdieria sulphuraria]|eukprot:XP_005708631.1 hypothetical protein Gasu_08530 [Galdieria sulphuraria]